MDEYREKLYENCYRTYERAMAALLGRPIIDDPQNEFDKIKETSLSQVKLMINLYIAMQSKTQFALQFNVPSIFILCQVNIIKFYHSFSYYHLLLCSSIKHTKLGTMKNFHN